MKRSITLTENDLRDLIKESVIDVLKEANWLSRDNQQENRTKLVDMLLCPHAVQMRPDANGNEVVINAYYKPKDLQNLYANQDKLSRFERIVLQKAMWGRARRANYQSYDNDWGIVSYKNNTFYVNDTNGKLITADNDDFKRICTPEFLSEPTTSSKYGL
jgi:hypothetical protein